MSGLVAGQEYMETGTVNGTRTKMLSEARSNETVRVVRLHGGRGLSDNLAGLGVLPGTTVRVVAKGSSGPVVIACRGGRIAIGRGMAERVEVVEQPPAV